MVPFFWKQVLLLTSLIEQKTFYGQVNPKTTKSLNLLKRWYLFFPKMSTIANQPDETEKLFMVIDLKNITKSVHLLKRWYLFYLKMSTIANQPDDTEKLFQVHYKTGPKYVLECF
jgi:hypothetical protein